MNDAVIPELELLAFSFLSGVICFFAYDLLLVLRIFFRPSWLFEKAEDILYWLAASIFVFSVIYVKNSGVIRAYSVFGMLAGAGGRGAFRLPLFFSAAVGDEPFGLLPAAAFHRFAVPLLGPILKGQCPCFRRSPGSKPRSLPCLSLGQQRGTIKQRY